MAMTNEAWNALAQRRAEQARTDPRGYRVRVAAWAVSGYGVLLLALAAALAGLAGIVESVVAAGAPTIALKLTIPLALMGWVVARSLFVKVPPPTGLELRRHDAPALFNAIDRLRTELDAPHVHHVLLDGDYNASIVQIPRLGPFGRPRNYLTLGLAYMQALSQAQLEAVIAHELGHISRSHGRFGVWIYRVRNSWERVARELDVHGFWGAGVARRFYGWYVPRLQACSVALVREHELEADRASAEAAGARDAALALVRATAMGPAVDGYWSSVFARVPNEPLPPADAFRGLRAALREQPGEAGGRALTHALATPTRMTDSHPGLAERLGSLGQAPDALGDAMLTPPISAADALLSPEAHRVLCDRLGAEWWSEVREQWAAEHAAAAQARERLAAIERRPDAIDVVTARERAGLVGRLRDEDAALAAWQDVLALDARDGSANLAVGALLLRRDDERGLAHLDRAIAGSPLQAAEAADIAGDWLAARGRAAEAARYRAVLDRQVAVLEAAEAERAGLSRDDELEPHGLAPEAVAALSNKLSEVGKVARAYVVRKRVAHLADDAPLYVIGVERARSWWRPEGPDDDRLLVRRVLAEIELPGETLAVPLAKPTRWLSRRLKDVDGALVYGR